MAGKDPYQIMEEEKRKIVEDAQKTDDTKEIKKESSNKTNGNQQIPVKDTNISFVESDSWFEIILMVIIDIIARIMGKDSPTGGKIPKKINPKNVDQNTDKLKNAVGKGFSNIGNKLEETAGYLSKSGSELMTKTSKNIQENTKKLSENGLSQSKGLIESAGKNISGRSSRISNVGKDVSNQTTEIYKQSLKTANQEENTDETKPKDRSKTEEQSK